MTIVPTPTARVGKQFRCVESRTVNVSFGSCTVSPAILTLITPEVARALIVSTAMLKLKSSHAQARPGTLVTPDVANLTSALSWFGPERRTTKCIGFQPALPSTTWASEILAVGGSKL